PRRRSLPGRPPRTSLASSCVKLARRTDRTRRISGGAGPTTPDAADRPGDVHWCFARARRARPVVPPALQVPGRGVPVYRLTFSHTERGGHGQEGRGDRGRGPGRRTP